MDSYQVASLVLNVLSAGVKAEQIQQRLDAAIASGVASADVPALLAKWRDEAIADAASAKPGDPEPKSP